jgi:hypothetical protein
MLVFPSQILSLLSVIFPSKKPAAMKSNSPHLAIALISLFWGLSRLMGFAADELSLNFDTEPKENGLTFNRDGVLRTPV